MIVGFGKYGERTIEEILLKEPVYVKWVLGQNNANRALASLQRELAKKITRIDQEQFTVENSCEGCGKPAVRCSIYAANVSLFFWCIECNPHEVRSAPVGKLIVAASFGDVLSYMDSVRGGKGLVPTIIAKFLAAKGIPDTPVKLKRYFERWA